MVIVSLTSIPSRFQYLPQILENLVSLKGACEVWLNIPHKYNRWPDLEFEVPQVPPGVVLNRCKDYGPGTMYFGPLDGGCTAENIVVVNDDTNYPANLVTEFSRLMRETPGCWCTSGFRVEEYVLGNGRVSRYDNQRVDVTESYGGVILKREWLDAIKPEFENLLSVTYNDDILVSNLMSKHGVPRFSVCNPTLNIGMAKQYSYGMEQDALWQNDGDGSHYPNNCQVFRTLREKGAYYY